MLGYVHAGIGDANNIFHGKPVYGKASHAKAASNVLFLKHGISRYPQAQALGQYLRLFDSGFRHQDNEFVPAVASHYIRLPALLLKESANASQHQIAFQMPLRVIDLFKLIQVHQHESRLSSSRHSTDDAGPKRNPFAKDLRRNARLRPDLDLFREVIKNSDSDVIEAKIFLDMADDLGKHLLGILARDGCLRDAVEKSKLAGAALFFGEEPRIFHRDR